MHSAPKRPLNHEALFVKSCALTLKDIAARGGEATPKDISYLQNMIQGYLLNFLFDKLSKYFSRQCHINCDNRMLVVLGRVLSPKVFARVRETFRAEPMNVVHLSQLIVEFNSEKQEHSFAKTTDFYRKLLSILYPDEDIRQLQTFIMRNTEVKKLVLIYRFEKHISDKECLCRFSRLLDKEDPTIVMPMAKRYFNAGRYKRFSDMIVNGEWRIEANFLKTQLSA